MNELTTNRSLVVGTAKLNQHEGILTLKFGSKDMLLWKRGFAFVSIEDERLWIRSRLIWFG